jgi:hypothetical protein
LKKTLFCQHFGTFFPQKWHLANVGVSGESLQNGLANFGNSGKSLQNGVANVGDSGDSSLNWLVNVGGSSESRICQKRPF